jgi:glycosyltransferase involved in cell wall biosynthesis
VLNSPDISVIIPVHNGGESFRQCLSALTEISPAPGEIIVVTDACTDDSEQLAEALGVRVLRTPKKSGPARARNLGAQTAHGDILFFVDADVLVQPDAIAQVLAAFREEPHLTAVFGSYDDTPAASNFLSQYKNLFHHYIHQTAKEEASTFWSGCGAIRRDVFLAARGFNSGFKRPAIEDVELGYRLKRDGHLIRLRKTLKVKHLKRWGILSLLKTDFFDRALPWTRLILRDRRIINDLNLRHSSRASVMLVYVLLVALAAARWWPGFLAVAGAAILLLLALNAPVYRFFLRRRNLWFALRVIPWHWLYYFYSGLAFAIGLTRYSFNRRRGRQPRASQTTGRSTQ